MNDPIMNEGVWPTWLQQAAWLEWVQPSLYSLLAIALVSLIIALLDLALLCWKEFHAAKGRETTKARTKTIPVNEVNRVSVAALKKQGYDAIKVLLLLLCCCQFSPVVFAQDQPQALKTAIRDGDLMKVKSLLAKGANVNAPLVEADDGTTPLMHAVVNTEADCVKLLLGRGADPTLTNKAGISAAATSWAVMALALTTEPANTGTPILW